MGPTAAVPAQISPVRTRLSSIIARLAGANVLVAASGFITGPLLARALGASGRGDLAAVIVPLGLAPYILNLGIPTFANRELPRGRPLNLVLGSLGAPLLAMGAVSVLAAVPVADALAGDRETVRTLLIITFCAMPLLLVGNLLVASLAGLERWPRVIRARLIPVAVSLCAIVALYAAGRLTVANAGAFAIAGAVLSGVPGLTLLRAGGRPVFRLAYAIRGVTFGLKTWLGTIALLANARVDQLVMITAVAPRELGLYAVAVTLAGASTLLTSAISPPLITRLSEGHTELVPQALRITLAATVLLNLVLALACPFLLPALFGDGFRDAVPMAAVLLVAAVPFAGTSVLTATLQAGGAPIIPSIAEGIALVITGVGLFVLLGPLGGLGAAIVSVLSYSASFGYQLVMVRRRIPAPLSEYLLPAAADLRWARALL